MRTENGRFKRGVWNPEDSILQKSEAETVPACHLAAEFLIGGVQLLGFLNPRGFWKDLVEGSCLPVGNPSEHLATWAIKLKGGLTILQKRCFTVGFDPSCETLKWRPRI